MIALIFLILLGSLIYYGVSKYKNHFTQTVIIPSKMVVFLATLVAGFNFLLFEANPGIGWSLFFVIFFGFFFSLFPQEKRTFFVYFFSIAGILAGLFLAGRANDFMLSVNLTTLFFSTIFLLILKNVDDAEKHLFAFIRGAWASFFAVFRQFGGLYNFAQTHKEKGKFNILQILKTGALTVLVIVVFVSLLSQADPVFAQIMEDFFGNIEKRFLLSLLITALATIGFTIAIKPNAPINTKMDFLNYYDFIIPLSVLIALLGVFLGVQFTYLFGGQADLSAFDLTFSEYVRKGFLELLIATFFGLLVSGLILLKEDFLADKEKKILKMVHLILLLELLLMLVSAFKRDVIYIDSYGLTRIRVVGGLFLIWLAGLFVLIASDSLFKKLSKKHILWSASGFGLFFFALLNTANIDQMIVNYNAKNFPEKQDIFYHSLLSEDAVKGWEDAILISQKTYNDLAEKTKLSDTEKTQLAEALLTVKSSIEKRDELFDFYGTLEEMKQNDYADIPNGFPDNIKFKRKWQAYNLGEKLAFSYIKTKANVFEKTLDCLDKNIDFYQIKNDLSLSLETDKKMSEYDYPLTQRFYYYNDIDLTKRDIFNYFWETYYKNNEYSGRTSYTEDLKPLLQEIKSKMQININDVEDYPKNDFYYTEFEKLLIELIEVEKCD